MLKKQFNEHFEVLGADYRDEVRIFDRKAVLSSYRKNELYGNEGDWLKKSQWPEPSDLEAKSDRTVRNLRLKKVEWTICKDIIFNFRLTLSDGSVSHQAGDMSDLTEAAEFPDERPIRSVRVGHSTRSGVLSLQFLDAKKWTLVEIESKVRRGFGSANWSEK